LNVSASGCAACAATPKFNSSLAFSAESGDFFLSRQIPSWNMWEAPVIPENPVFSAYQQVINMISTCDPHSGPERAGNGASGEAPGR
jgi:hypothetical protein